MKKRVTPKPLPGASTRRGVWFDGIKGDQVKVPIYCSNPECRKVDTTLNFFTENGKICPIKEPTADELRKMRCTKCGASLVVPYTKMLVESLPAALRDLEKVNAAAELVRQVQVQKLTPEEGRKRLKREAPWYRQIWETLPKTHKKWGPALKTLGIFFGGLGGALVGTAAFIGALGKGASPASPTAPIVNVHVHVPSSLREPIARMQADFRSEVAPVLPVINPLSVAQPPRPVAP